MNVRLVKICALGLALAIVPGAAEILDSGVHLLMEGDFAHSPQDGAQLDDHLDRDHPDRDHHGPTGPEHGCSTTFHLCSCHASLCFLKPPSSPSLGLRLALFPLASVLVEAPAGFVTAIDRPPQVSV